MAKKSGSRYLGVGDGRQWARGLNKYEDQGIKEFERIRNIGIIAGGLIGVGLSLWWQPPWYGYLLIIVAAMVLGFLLGRGFAQIWIPHRWEEMLGHELERRGHSRQGHIRELGGFTKDATRPHPDIFTTIFSLGMIKKRKLRMESNRLYLADVGFNDICIYDTQSAGNRDKVFWKLNVQGAPEIEVYSIPYRLDDTTVDVEGIPVMGTDESQRRRNAWIKVSYRIWIQLEIDRDRVDQFVKYREPMRVVKNIARKRALELLPFQKYEDVVAATTSDQLRARLMESSEIVDLGFNLIGVHIEEIDGSKQLDESLQKSFETVSKAKDLQEIAVSLADMDDHIVEMMFEYEGNQAALEHRSRAAMRSVEAMLALGVSPQQLHQITKTEAAAIGQSDSYAQLMVDAVESIEGVSVESPELACPTDIPTGITHSERLKWEDQELKARMPHVYKGLVAPESSFAFQAGTGQELVIIFPEPGMVPHIYLDGKPFAEDDRALAHYALTYKRETVCSLYNRITRKLS